MTASAKVLWWALVWGALPDHGDSFGFFLKDDGELQRVLSWGSGEPH